MKKINLQRFGVVCLVIFLSVQQSSAQRWFRTSSLEFGLIGGMSHYSGDLTQSYFEGRGFKPSIGLITRYTPRQRLTFRLSAQYGAIEGRDDWYEDPDDLERRNLSFQSKLWDFTGAMELNLNTIDMRDPTGVQPYLFTGFSVFRFNPKSEFTYDPGSAMDNYLGVDGDGNRVYAQLADRDGELVELQPLGTEGQETTEFNERRRYALTQIAIPIGAGFKFKVSNNWNVGIEYGTRITFTDYMDDVSQAYVDPVRLQQQYGAMSATMSDRSPTLHSELAQDVRGDDKKRDLYGILGITLTYRIYGNRAICPSF